MEKIVCARAKLCDHAMRVGNIRIEYIKYIYFCNIFLFVALWGYVYRFWIWLSIIPIKSNIPIKSKKSKNSHETGLFYQAWS